MTSFAEKRRKCDVIIFVRPKAPGGPATIVTIVTIITRDHRTVNPSSVSDDSSVVGRDPTAPSMLVVTFVVADRMLQATPE
jgi:hypothetical protein